MISARLSAIVALILGVLASAALAGQSWPGELVMPKSAEFELRADDGSSVSIYDFEWPAKVQRTRGRFLWLQDEGGYSRRPAGGWIYCDDVVKIGEARDHYSRQLQGGESAWLYWMRGISWEAQNEPGIAILDYQNALRIAPRSTLDDIHIRLGHLLAQRDGFNLGAMRNDWESQFEMAKAINPNRPQLFYEWGRALSQACSCTLPRILSSNQGPQRNSSSESATPDPARQKPAETEVPGKNQTAVAGDLSHRAAKKTEKSRGIDLDLEAPAEPRNSTTANNSETPEGSQKNVEAMHSPILTAEIIELGTTAKGPTPEGSNAAVLALHYYEQAEGLNPRWWRIPLARAELMLNQCEDETDEGEQVPRETVKPEFYATLLHHCKKGVELLAKNPTPPVSAVAVRDADTAAKDTPKNHAARPDIVALTPDMARVLTVALDDYNQAISLNPSAIDAYRDRAEVLRTIKQLNEAHQSALIACRLGNYRQAGSLRTLAQINYDLSFYQPATAYALRAAELASGEERERFLHLWKKCSGNCEGDEAQILAESQKQGFVASDVNRDVDITGKNRGANQTKSTNHVEAPPGFLSRSSD